MLVRPRNLTNRLSATKAPEKFTMPIDAARCKAREIINQLPQNRLISVIENWRLLSDGQIEFTVRHLTVAD